MYYLCLSQSSRNHRAFLLRDVLITRHIILSYQKFKERGSSKFVSIGGLQPLQLAFKFIDMLRLFLARMFFTSKNWFCTKLVFENCSKLGKSRIWIISPNHFYEAYANSRSGSRPDSILSCFVNWDWRGCTNWREGCPPWCREGSSTIWLCKTIK